MLRRYELLRPSLFDVATAAADHEIVRCVSPAIYAGFNVVKPVRLTRRETGFDVDAAISALSTMFRVDAAQIVTGHIPLRYPCPADGAFNALPFWC